MDGSSDDKVKGEVEESLLNQVLEGLPILQLAAAQETSAVSSEKCDGTLCPSGCCEERTGSAVQIATTAPKPSMAVQTSKPAAHHLHFESNSIFPKFVIKFLENNWK